MPRHLDSPAGALIRTTLFSLVCQRGLRQNPAKTTEKINSGTIAIVVVGAVKPRLPETQNNYNLLTNGFVVGEAVRPLAPPSRASRQTQAGNNDKNKQT